MQIVQVLVTLFFVQFSGLVMAQSEAVFSTYLGGSKNDHPAGDVFIDDKGFIYITGSTNSSDFPVTKGAFDTSFNDRSGSTDAFVAKLDPLGEIIWSTFIGTPTRDVFYNIKVDADGYVYLAGAFGPGAPTTPGVVQEKFAGADSGSDFWDGYLVKLKPDGSGMVWATYLGTNGSDSLRSMDIDAKGNFVVVSRNRGGGWPREWFAGRFQDKPQGGVDTVVIKVGADAKEVLWASYLGGSSDESRDPNVCLDKAGHVHILTTTRSMNIPTTQGAYDRSYNGELDIYVGTLSADGKNLLMGTYLGTSTEEGAGGKRGIQIDDSGNLFISGWTRSSNFPTTHGAYRKKPMTYTPWGVTGITAKFSPEGKLLASTYIGDSEGLSLDSRGNVYIGRQVWSDDVPVSDDAFQKEWNGVSDGALLILSNDLSWLRYATYLGGKLEDAAHMTAIGPGDVFLVTGQTSSSDYKVVRAMQRKNAGARDIFIVKFKPLP